MATDKKESPGKLRTLYAIYELYTNWNTMSPAQKTRAIGALGIQGYSFASGQDLAKEWIIEPTAGKADAIGLNIGQAFDLFSQGYNAYSVAKNWKQLNSVQKVVNGGKTLIDIANTGKNMNLLGFGTQGAAVKGTSAQALSSAGWSAAPNYGVGAVTGKVGSQIPAGYTTLASGGEGVIAIPTATLPSGTGAIGAANVASRGGLAATEAANAAYNAPATAATEAAAEGGIGSALGTAAGAAAFAAGAYQVSQGWGEGGTKGIINGALGGSMMAGGLYAMGLWNPYAAAAIVGVSLMGNMIKTGKHEDQVARDGVLGFMKERGYVGKDNSVTLPDGTVIDLGIDGRGNLHSVTNVDKLAANDKKRGEANGLGWYDIDYTNDLDYVSNMGGQALMAMLSGGKSKATSQVGGKLANGVIQGIGYGQEFTEENYAKVRDNYRAIYSQMGITSKSDGYQLLNQMYADGRLEETDLVTYQQGLNMIYDDNGYETAQTLMNGRHRGIEVAAEDMDSDPDETVNVSGTPSSIDPGRFPAVNPPSETLKPGANTFLNPPAEIKAAYAPKPLPRPTSQQTQPMPRPTTTEAAAAPQQAASNISSNYLSNFRNGAMSTKEDAQARNQQNYLSSFRA